MGVLDVLFDTVSTLLRGQVSNLNFECMHIISCLFLSHLELMFDNPECDHVLTNEICGTDNFHMRKKLISSSRVINWRVIRIYFGDLCGI